MPTALHHGVIFDGRHERSKENAAAKSNSGRPKSFGPALMKFTKKHTTMMEIRKTKKDSNFLMPK